MSARNVVAPSVTFEKECTRCHVVKLLGAFGHHPLTSDSRKSWCRDCDREYRIEHRAATNYRYERAYNKARRRATAALVDAHHDEYEALLDAEMRAEGLR